MSQLTDTFTSIADAIRYKTGGSSSFTPAQMPSEIMNIPTGPNIVQPFQYVSSSMSYYEGNETFIGDRAFISCTSLTSLSFPSCSYIGQKAFSNLGTVTNIYFPECEYIGAEAFRKVYFSWMSLEFSKCKEIGSAAFASMGGSSKRFTNISFPLCKEIGEEAFANCQGSLNTNITFPECTTVGSSAFYNFTHPYGGGGSSYYEGFYISFPKLYTITPRCFESCSPIMSFYAPLCTTIHNSAFFRAGIVLNGETSFIPTTKTIISYAFANAYFYGSNSWTSIPTTSLSFPNVTYLGEACFAGAWFEGIKSITFPASRGIQLNESYIFANANIGFYDEGSSTRAVYFSDVTYIDPLAFEGAIFKYLHFLGSSVAGYDYWRSNPIVIPSAISYIYVKSSLVNSYKTHVLWSHVSSKIVGF